MDGSRGKKCVSTCKVSSQSAYNYDLSDGLYLSCDLQLGQLRERIAGRWKLIEVARWCQNCVEKAPRGKQAFAMYGYAIDLQPTI